MSGVCSIDDCELKVFSRQWRQKHYARWLRHGDPLATKAPGRDSGRRDRGTPYIYVRQPDCPFSDQRGWVAEHRYVMWKAGFLTDQDHHVHHKNGDKRDNRVENLEVLTASEHAAHHGEVDRPSHCPHGHEYTPENSFFRKGTNSRECRTCMRERTARQRAAKKAAACESRLGLLG